MRVRPQFEHHVVNISNRLGHFASKLQRWPTFYLRFFIVLAFHAETDSRCDRRDGDVSSHPLVRARLSAPSFGHAEFSLIRSGAGRILGTRAAHAKSSIKSAS